MENSQTDACQYLLLYLTNKTVILNQYLFTLILFLFNFQMNNSLHPEHKKLGKL